jgi:hypothetical protein
MARMEPARWSLAMKCGLVACLLVPLSVACGDDGGSTDDGALPPDGDADGIAEDDGGGDADTGEDAEVAPDAPDAEDIVDIVDIVEEAPPPPVVVTPAADLLPAADPKLPGFGAWPLAFDVDPGGRGGLRCRVTLARAPTTLATIAGTVTSGRCAVAWDGRDSGGGWLAPGAVTASVEVLAAATDEVLAETSAELEVVRLGIDSVQLSAGTTGKRVDLLWAEMGGVAEGYYEAVRDSVPWSLARDASEPAAAVDLELADGSPRPLPDVWTDLQTPPTDAAAADGVEHDTYNLPTAWVAGSIVELTATLSSDVAGAPGGGAPVASEVRLIAPEGTRLVGEGPFAAGGSVAARATASPVPAVGRYDWTLEWRFESRRPGGAWMPVPGSLTTVHRLYGVVGLPLFRRTDVPHRAWVEVLDAIAGWVDGATADPMAVAGHLVEGIYYELGLRYDNVRGASAYTEYLDGWNDGVFYIVAFQRRDFGSTINCSDAASILSSYANMIGIDLRYHILEHAWADGFDLNYIQAIGFTAFDETPFVGGGGSFGYHAVTGPVDGTIYDATLALDGDGTPTAPPHTLLLAQGLPPEEYLFDLSSDWEDVVIHTDDTVTLR